MVTNISEYLQEVNKAILDLNLHNTTSPAWFRGQSDEGFKLIPSIYRHNFLPEYERDINRDFKLLSKQLLQETSPEDEFEWLYLMQHYGLPTRLLDWTESSLVGLYFAVSNLSKTNNSVVWVLSPRRYNFSILKRSNTVPISNSDLLKDYLIKPDKGNTIHRKVKDELPLALRPTKNSSRILAQRGFFTIHGYKNICINELVTSRLNKTEPILKKIIIHKDFKLAILKELYNCGISPSVIFPELTGISEELVMKYTTFYSKNNSMP